MCQAQKRDIPSPKTAFNQRLLSFLRFLLSFGRSNPLVGKPRLFEKVSVNKHIEIRERQEQFLLREVLPQTFGI